MKTLRLNGEGQIISSRKLKENKKRKRKGKPSAISEWKADKKKDIPKPFPLLEPVKPPKVNGGYACQGDFLLRDELMESSPTDSSSDSESVSAGAAAEREYHGVAANFPHMGGSDSLPDYDSDISNTPNISSEPDTCQGVRSDTFGPKEAVNELNPSLDQSLLDSDRSQENSAPPSQDPKEEVHAPLGFVLALQEPSIFNDNVVNMGGAEAIFDRSIPNDQVRAALVFNPQLNMWEVNEFCNRDMATTLWTGTSLEMSMSLLYTVMTNNQQSPTNSGN